MLIALNSEGLPSGEEIDCVGRTVGSACKPILELDVIPYTMMDCDEDLVGKPPSNVRHKVAVLGNGSEAPRCRNTNCDIHPLSISSTGNIKKRLFTLSASNIDRRV